MKFKLWIKENLAGAGDGPMFAPFDLEKINLDIARKGAGAFNVISNNEKPPINKCKKMNRK